MDEIISNPSDQGSRSPPLVATPPQTQAPKSLRDTLEESRMPPEVPLPEEEMLPNAPLVDLPVPEGPKQPYQEFPVEEEEGEEKEIDFEESNDYDYTLHDKLIGDQEEDPLHGKPLLRILLAAFEITLVSVLLMVPSLVLMLWKGAPHYSFIAIKQGPLLNGYMEFVRWSAFLTTTYDIWVVMNLIMQTIPTVLVAIAKKSPVKWKPSKVRMILALKQVRVTISLFLWLLTTLWVAALLLYSPKLSLAGGNLKTASDALKLAEQAADISHWESLLVGAFIFSMLLAVEKYFMRFVAFKLHHSLLASRIEKTNRALNWLERLDRATSRRARRLMAEKRRPPLPQGTGELEVSKSKQAALHDRGNAAVRAKVIGSSIFHGLAQGKDHLTPEDFRPVLGEQSYYVAWLCFDPVKEHKLSKEGFCRAITGLYEERDQLEANQVSNGLVLFKFDALLMVMVTFMGLIPFLWLAVPIGYVWILTAALFAFSIFVLLKELFTKIFNSFLFVFVEQAYQVGEHIWWEGQRHLVVKIDIFATHLIREDGTRGHLPTALISPKNIINLSRNPCHRDLINLQARSPVTLGSVQGLKKPLDEWLKETFNEYTGKCQVKLEEKSIKVEVIFNPILDVTGEALASRRSVLKTKLMEIANNGGIIGEIIE